MDSIVAAQGQPSMRPEDAVTPELALVDPVLSRHARSWLPEPDDTLARVEALIQTSRIASLAQRSMELPARSDSKILGPSRRASRVGQRRSSAVPGAVAAGALVLALLVGVRVELSGTPAGADTAEIEELPASSIPKTPTAGGETTPHPEPNQPPPTTNPAPQRFAWAPVPGASAYHVELFRGSSKVFEADTREPAITIPARWVFDRRSQGLEPGDYRWYVWPLASGRRAARAIVQARLTIPPR